MMAYRRGTRGENIVSIIVLLFIVGFVIALSLPVFFNERGSRRNELMYNMRDIGLATTNFHSTFGQFPPLLPDGTTGPDVKKPISFLTTLLPFLEHPRLYEKIDKSLTWTHSQNRDAYGTRVTTFEWPAQPPVDYDNDKTPAGFAITYIVPSSRIVSRPGDLFRLEDITDGTGSTVMLGNIDDAHVPAWGDPAMARDPALGFAGGPYAFGGLPSGALIVFADGHAGSISKNIDPAVAKALATPDGGETVGAY